MITVNNTILEGVVVQIPSELLENSTTQPDTTNLKVILMTYGAYQSSEERTYQYYAIRFTKSLIDIVSSDPELRAHLKGTDDAALMKELLDLRLFMDNGQLDSGTINFYKTPARNPDEFLFAKPVVYVYADSFKITGFASAEEKEKLLQVYNNWGETGGGYEPFP